LFPFLLHISGVRNDGGSGIPVRYPFSAEHYTKGEQTLNACASRPTLQAVVAGGQQHAEPWRERYLGLAIAE